MVQIVACVDRSPYALAVCDYAVWFADRMDGEILIFAVEESGWPKGSAEVCARRAGQRLLDHGFDRLSIKTTTGEFLRALTSVASQSDFVIMGKRGMNRSATLEHLGAHVEPTLRLLTAPTCLVSQVFLPISRPLAVLDSNPAHRRALEYATSSGLLNGLVLNAMLMDDGRHTAGQKLTEARTRLSATQGAAFAVHAENADLALASYPAGADLIVLSREMLFGPAGSPLAPGDDDSFWRRRTPILVC